MKNEHCHAVSSFLRHLSWWGTPRIRRRRAGTAEGFTINMNVKTIRNTYQSR